MFATEYESFHIDYELEHDMFKLDDVCYTSARLITFASEFDPPATSLGLKPFFDSLKYLFLGLDKPLLVITSNLDMIKRKNDYIP